MSKSTTVLHVTLLSIDVSKITRLISIISITRSIHWFFYFNSSGISIKSSTTVIGLGRVDRPFSVEMSAQKILQQGSHLLWSPDNSEVNSAVIPLSC